MSGGYHPQKNTEQFIAEATLKHSGKYTYEKTVYTRSTDKVIINCPTHGDFEIGASKHLLGQKCNACATEDTAKSQRLTTEQFVSRSEILHGGKYDYRKVDIVDAQSIVEVVCPIHGDFKIRAIKHMHGQECRACGMAKAAKTRKIDKEYFVEKATSVHGTKYNYDLVDIDGAKKPVSIICPQHGNFQLSPDKHMGGRGCPKCSWNGAGFDPAKPASLYILTCGDITKVGITNRKVAARVHGINRASGLVFKLSTSIFSEDGGFIRAVEQKTLKWLRSKYKTVDKKFDGYTECFVSVDMEELLEFISPNVKHTEEL